MGYHIFTIILTALGVTAIIFRRKKQQELFELKATQPVTIKEITDTCQSIHESLGTPGGFKLNAEVSGVVTCDDPLTGELSKKPCVFYEMTVTEHTTGSDGKRQSRVITTHSRRVNFCVKDRTGILTVNPEGARIEAEQVYSKFDQLREGGALNEFAEKIIPLGSNIFVLGEAADASGEVTMRAPSEKEKPFIITLKSKEELQRATQKAIDDLKIGAIIVWVGAALLFSYGLFAK